MMDYDADRRLASRISMVRRHWRWVVAGGGACGLTALIVSLFLPKIYRATTFILVSESKIGAPSQVTAWQYATLATYVPFVDNDELITQSIRTYSLDQPPYNLTVDRFRRKDYLDVSIRKSSRLVELNVEFPDARLAANLANSLARSAVELNDHMNAADTLATQRILKSRLDEAEANAAAAAARRLEVRERAKIEDREKEVSILLTEKEQLSAQLQSLRLSREQNRGKATALERELKTEPRTFHLTKSITEDRFLERAAGKAGDGEAPLSMTEESLNATHEEIRQQLVDSRATASADEAGTLVATQRLEQVNAQLSRSLAEFTRLKSEMERADREYSLAQEALESATRDYRNASVTVSSKSQDLKQLAPAIPPERPVRPSLPLNTVLGTLLGLTLFGGAAVAVESFRELHAVTHRLFEEEETVSVGRG
jgi:uncharacterized protein involved in exopolysaccharide biosynthesis